MIKAILLAFIPIFFAVDPIGLLPVFVGLTADLKRKEKRTIIIQSLATALGLSVGFIFLGKIIFKFLGITIGDFMVAGGAILFCLSMIDLIQSGKSHREKIRDLGVVPIGTPLIVGPAVLTICLMMIEAHGIFATLTALLLNLLIVGLMFLYSGVIIKVLGEPGARALSKIMALLLAAIGVMMIRKGLVTIMCEFSVLAPCVYK